MIKLTVNITEGCLAALESHSIIHNVTKTEALGRALGLLRFHDLETAKGTQFLLKDKHGDFRELLVGKEEASS